MVCNATVSCVSRISLCPIDTSCRYLDSVAHGLYISTLVTSMKKQFVNACFVANELLEVSYNINV